MSHSLRRYLAAFLILKGSIWAGEWAVVTEGGQSPDKKLAVAVIPQKGKALDDADGTVLLVDQVSSKKIGPLEEVDSTGGGFGTTTTNLRCQWSKDSSLLIVNFRVGRLMQSSQIYRIRGRRAIPVELPDVKTHPKGKVFEVLSHTVNPGSEVSITKDGAILERRWGIMPTEAFYKESGSKYGLKDVEGELLLHYRFDKKGQLQLTDITVPKPS